MIVGSPRAKNRSKWRQRREACVASRRWVFDWPVSRHPFRCHRPRSSALSSVAVAWAALVFMVFSSFEVADSLAVRAANALEDTRLISKLSELEVGTFPTLLKSSC